MFKKAFCLAAYPIATANEGGQQSGGLSQKDDKAPNALNDRFFVPLGRRL